MSKDTPALLVLEDGNAFHGKSIGSPGHAVGEVVFNTAMTGYQEILTDPSYARQIVTLTYPHIGNTGTNDEDWESTAVYAEALVIRDLPSRASNQRSQRALDDYLAARGVVGIADIDTRRLTRIIREKGALSGCVSAGTDINEEDTLARAQAFEGLLGMDLAQHVSRDEVQAWDEGAWTLQEGYAASQQSTRRVVAYDFGVKNNILRLLVDRGCEVIVVPAKTSAQDALSHKPDGIFLSNGPGDPEPCSYAIDAIREFLQLKIPVFGICLGCQLLALASGAKTVKMRHGHHGANHPVKDLDSNRVLITSQNHGFCVDSETLPNNVRMTHSSLFDGTLQGLELLDTPAFGFQGHPEASPGPQDCQALFDRFVAFMDSYKAGKNA